jgi:hypothetical protein
MALARKVDRRALKRERKMDVAKSHASIVDTAPMSMEGNVRTLMRSNRSPNVTKPNYDSVTSNDAFAAGAASITDIERLMVELQAARDYLRAEGDRVRQLNANYVHLAQTASASARVIADSIGKWNIPEQASGHQLPVAMNPNAFPDEESLSASFETQPALERQLMQMTAPSKP